MKYFRAAVYGIFLCSCILLVWILIYENVLKEEEKVNMPVITSSEEILELKMKEGNDTEKLLEGLLAEDEEDGDLTKEIKVTKQSEFTEPGVFTVTYEVSDLDGNTTYFSRDAHYTDYSSPRLKIEKEPVCTVGEQPDMTEFVSVTDKIDGDLTENIRVDSSKLNTEEPGLYPVTLKVTNSMNDTISYRMFLSVKEKTEDRTAIKLSQYSVTVKKKAEINPEDYINEVLDADGDVIEDPDLEITNEGSTKNAGVFPVIYRLDDDDMDAVAVLMVEIR